MTILTAIGRITSNDGMYIKRDPDGTPHVRHAPPAEYVTTQRAVPVWFEHDPDLVIGHATYLERSHRDGLKATARIEQTPLIDTSLDWYWSPGLRAAYRRTNELGRDVLCSIRITELSVTDSPAYTGQLPIRWTDLDLARSNCSTAIGWPLGCYDTARRAHERMRRFDYDPRRGLELVDVDFEELRSRTELTPLDAAIAHAERRVAEAATIRLEPQPPALTLVRSFPSELELSEGQLFGRLVPFDRAAEVADVLPDGRLDVYDEGFRRGAFAGQTGTGKSVANIELRHRHDDRGTGYLGPAVNLEEQPDGLHGEFKVLSSRRADVDDLLRSGVSGLSIEFVARPDGTTTEAGVRWRTAVRLQAVALEARGAYPDAAVTGYRGRVA